MLLKYRIWVNLSPSVSQTCFQILTISNQDETFQLFKFFAENDIRTIYLLIWKVYFIILGAKWLLLPDFHYALALSVDLEEKDLPKYEYGVKNN